MLIPTLINVDTTLEANLSELLLGVIVDVLHVEQQILLPQSSEVHVKLTGDKHLRHVADHWGVNRDLDPDETQYVIDCVESCDRGDRHEVCHVHQRPGLEQSKLAV